MYYSKNMDQSNLKELELNNYPLRTYDKVRYSDTDRQGHVNNAVFSTFFETGRVELLYNPDYPLMSDDGSFVIASIKLDFLSEIKWPGTIEIGTAVVKVGTSSTTLIQGLFQNGHLTATAETIIVQTNSLTSRSTPLSQRAKDILNSYKINL